MHTDSSVKIVTIETPSLGDRSYLVHDGVHGAVIDPQRDLDRILSAVEEARVEVVAVLETHIHNDYVSGGPELARRTGATCHVPAGEDVDFEHATVADGTVIEVGTIQIRAVHTPGHTPTHLSFVVAEDERALAVFTGGGLLFGSVGRTDLVSKDLTERLTRDQYRSVRSLAGDLADDVAVLPTHGFGSFCSSGETSGADESTIGRERRENQALTTQDEDAFVEDLMAGLDAYPAYYAHMAPRNRAGAGPVDLSSPEIVDGTELARRIHAGEWVVDLRSRKAFAAGHLVGTINVEVGDSFSTYLGWLIPWGTPLTLLGEHDDVAEAQRQLVRIGIDRPAGQASPGDLDERGATYATATFDEAIAAAKDQDDATILDVRRALEHRDSSLDGVVHIPLHELLERLDEVPDGQLWVHCQSGYRASIAASLLARAGHDVVLIDEEYPG